MFKDFLLRKMLRAQGVPNDQIDMFINLIKKNPELFNKIAQEMQEEIKKGRDKMEVGQEIMKKYENELRALMQN